MRMTLRSLAALGAGAMILMAAGTAFAQSTDEAALARGEYLVNTVMACGNCHTPKGPEGDLPDRHLAGGLEFDEVPFHVWASNITPDAETGIGAYSDDDLRKAIVEGVRPDGTPLAAIMPSSFYHVLTEADLDAVIAYLKSVPAVRSEMPVPEYKIDIKAHPFPGADKPIPESERAGDPVREGFYLATIAHCMECHTTRNERGEPDPVGGLGAGGFELRGPWGVTIAANITPDEETGIGAWTDEEIKTAISKGTGKDGKPLAPPMAFYAYANMTPEDLDAIVAYLRTIPPVSHAIAAQ